MVGLHMVEAVFLSMEVPLHMVEAPWEQVPGLLHMEEVPTELCLQQVLGLRHMVEVPTEQVLGLFLELLLATMRLLAIQAHHLPLPKPGHSHRVRPL